VEVDREQSGIISAWGSSNNIVFETIKTGINGKGCAIATEVSRQDSPFAQHVKKKTLESEREDRSFIQLPTSMMTDSARLWGPEDTSSRDL